MLSHKAIWRGIDLLAEKNHLSASGLAKRAGLDPTTFNKSKRTTKQGKPRWPSTESISKILEATSTPMTDFVGLVDDFAHGGTASTGRRMKCLRLTQVEREQAFDASGFPQGSAWEDIDFPAVTDDAAYAIELDRDIAAPTIRAGDVVVVSPKSSARRNDRVAVKLRNGGVEFGLLWRRTAQRVTLGGLTIDAEERSFEIQNVAWVARVVWLSQ